LAGEVIVADDPTWRPRRRIESDLFAAAEGDDRHRVAQLLAGAFQPNTPDSWGRTSLHYAAQQGALAAAELLVEAGADVNAQGLGVPTPLACAIQSWRRSPELVQLLRSAGADPYRRGPAGRTPRDWAWMDAAGDLLADLSPPDHFPSDPSLTSDDELVALELEVVVDAVRGVVDADPVALRAMEASGDPYLWTRDWGLWHQVTLRMPFGPPETWDIAVVRFDDGNCAADVTMWTREEGPSDLTLQLELQHKANGTISAIFNDLHVM
jgi:hypothetical protein